MVSIGKDVFHSEINDSFCSIITRNSTLEANEKRIYNIVLIKIVPS